MKNGNYEYKLLYSGQLSPIARLNDEDRVVEEYVYGSVAKGYGPQVGSRG